MDPNETEITIDENGQIQGLEAPAPEATDDGWQDGSEGAPAPEPEEPEAAPEDSEEDQVAPEDDGWEDTAKPEAKPDPDDVPPEDRDPKGKVPSWRVREIREQKDKEIQRLQAELEAVRSGKAPAQQQPAKEQPAQPGVDPEIQADPTVKDCSEKLDIIYGLLEQKNYDELGKHFSSAEHLNATISMLVSQRESRIAALETTRTINKQRDEAAAADRNAQALSKLVSDYDTAIKSSSIPNVTKYAQRVAANATKLNVGIRHLILTAEDKDVVTAAIGSNRKLFDELASIDTTKPMSAAQLAHVALKLGKAVAAYQAPKQSVVDDEPAPVQRTVQPTVTRRASRPTSVPRYRVEKDGTIVM